MIRKIALSAALVMGVSGQVQAAGAEAHVHDFAFSFEGPFGTYDQLQLQRGLKIYTEICAACHGLQYVPIRTLADPGGPALPEDQVRAYASQLLVLDEESNRQLYDAEKGEFRPLIETDHFPANHSANAPDLSLMAKKRAGFHGPYGLGINQFLKGMGGPEYIATLLTAYEDPPSCAPEDFPGYYNKAFPNGGFPESCVDENGHHMVEGSWIAMPQPLYGDDTEFEDGASTELEAEAQDVAAFLMWTAEPKLDARKETGFIAVLFLVILSVLLYLTNKRIWAPIKKKGISPAE